jgi:hypothetical protein
VANENTVNLAGTFTGNAAAGYNQCSVAIGPQNGIPVDAALVADVKVEVDPGGGHRVTVSNIRRPR